MTDSSPNHRTTRMHRRFNRSLSVDLTLGLVVTLILIEGLLLLFLYQRQSRIMQEEIEFKADDYALKLSEVLAVPMWDFDDKQIEKIGKGFLQNELVRQLRITNNQGNQILVLENPGDEGPLIKRAVDIQYNAQTIGHAEIVLSAAFYFQELVLLRNVLLTVLFASALVFFLASGLLLRLLLRKPLRVLAQGMDRIARGEFDHRSENLSYTELTGIAERFSQMAEQIKGREKALTDINKELHAVNTQVRRRIQYEQMLAELSAQAASAKDFSRFAENSLQLMGATFGFAWVGFYRSRSDDTHLSIVSEWPPRQQAKGPADLQMTGEGFGAELMDALRDRRTIMFIDPQLPDSAMNAQTDIQNLLAFPIEVQQQLYGGILFGGDSETSDWEDIRPLLETAVQIIVRFIESFQARELLSRSEARFRELADMLPETIFEMDRSGYLTYVNQSGRKQFGYGNRDLQAGMRALEMFAEAERPRLGNHIQAVLNGKAMRLKEFRAQHKDGSPFPTMVSSTPIRKSGQIKGLRGFVIDISDKKSLEERLQKANRMEAIGNLAAGVAHDLNNILSGLVGYPDLLLLDLPAESPMRSPIQAIKDTGLKAAAVVQDLLTLARRNIAELHVVNLNAVVGEYLDSPEHSQLGHRHPGIHVKLKLNDDLMNVAASAHHLSKCLMNLVVNAMEAMPAGGELQISTCNRYVDRPREGFETIPEGDYTVLSVIDSGIGISSEDLQNIFEPFYTKKRMGRSGTGLGMSVIWATVKDHAGFVDVTSKEGRGTRFDLYFPVTREMTTPRSNRIPVEDYLGSERILVVDDIPEQRRIAADMLGRLGYNVSTVASGEAAIEMIQQQAVDLVVLDMIMDPGIDGLETFQGILSLVPDQKTIIASGFAETKRVRAAQKLGAHSYLKKPYTLEKLGVTVRAALDHRSPA